MSWNFFSREFHKEMHDNFCKQILHNLAITYCPLVAIEIQNHIWPVPAAAAVVAVKPDTNLHSNFRVSALNFMNTVVDATKREKTSNSKLTWDENVLLLLLSDRLHNNNIAYWFY